MLNQFYIVFEKAEFDSFDLKHIQYNIYDRLRKLKYITYRRLEFLLVDDKKTSIDLEWDDKKTAKVRCYIDPGVISSIKDRKSIAVVYKIIFESLEVLWRKNSWDIEDLRHLHSEIERENFFSAICYGKTLVSPDKKYKADFYCEIHPEYTDYYMRFYKKMDRDVKDIKFLHGHPDPSIFFNFFSNRIWRDNEYFLLSNINKEIFYIFNVHSHSFSLEYRPIHNSLEECKNYVAAFQANIAHNERMRLLGFPTNE